MTDSPAPAPAESPISANPDTHSHHPKASFMTLLLGSIGVVYGDIGTSPLYAMRESLLHVQEGGIRAEEILGVISLLVWSLVIVVTLKYIVFVLRADNKGEGGTLSLMALAQGVLQKRSGIIVMLGMIGAALFYGDSILTPAISVLSAVEGFKLVTPVFEPYVVPLTLAILIGLFAVQSHGTGKMAKFFGPITLLWFLSMAACAVPYLILYPDVFRALLPQYGFSFLIEHHMISMVVLGSVFLAVTGAEALYADMGHFGPKPIRTAWIFVVFPALIINYLGQGALILHNPAAIENPFFLMAPSWGLLPLVILASMATIIASQAVITGAFSLTQQAIQLGLLPRLEIRHTSEEVHGQIFMPQINLLLLIGVVILVLEFRNSGSLASAYGIAVSGTMLMTSCLFFIVVWKVWKKSAWIAALITVPFLFIESVFVTANLMKLLDGGYIPLALGAAIVVLMWTWRTGSRILMEKSRKDSIPLSDFLRMLEKTRPVRVPGTAIFLTSEPEVAPTAMLHNLKHNKVIHESNIVMCIRTLPTPRAPKELRVVVEKHCDYLARVWVHFGYMETPDVPAALSACRKHGLKLDIMSTSFFLGKRTIRASAKEGMPLWQDKIYIFLGRNATNATDFYHIPPGRVVEMGTQLTI